MDKNTRIQLYRHVNKPSDRLGVWIFPKEIIGSSEWLNSIWEKRKNIANKPSLLIWGMKDIAFRQKELDTFCSFLKNSHVIKLDDVGHYVQDEAGERIILPILSFLHKN